MKRKVKNNVYWVGKTDWDLRKFHGNEYSTNRGSTYNSYLIDEEKKVLIDTVWSPFSEEFVEALVHEIDLSTIDAVVANHAEIDHAGALPKLMELLPNVPLYCTKNGVDSLSGMYHKPWNFKIVKTGDTLSLGNGKDLIFIEAPMLHWPDSMMTYLTQDNILFSNDAFGQHYASEFLFNDLVAQDELFAEAIKYYANILTPFSSLVKKKIEELLSLKVPVDIIAPSHGVIWRDNPIQIVEKYLEWANDYQENQITLIYDTMWDSTKTMAEYIVKGIQAYDKQVKIKLFNSAKTDKNDLITEIFRSKAVLFGSATINKGILVSMAGLLEEVLGLRFKKKKAAAFGAYGWSAEGPSILQERAKQAGFDVYAEGLKVKWNPDQKAREQCEAFGKEFAQWLSN